MYVDYITPEYVVTDVKAINNAISNILLTRKGSVPGKPRFGSDIHKIIFSQIDPITEMQTKYYIRQALGEYEPRIAVTDISITSIPEYNRLVIDIYYRYRDEGVIKDASASLSVAQ